MEASLGWNSLTASEFVFVHLTACTIYTETTDAPLPVTYHKSTDAQSFEYQRIAGPKYVWSSKDELGTNAHQDYF